MLDDRRSKLSLFVVAVALILGLGLAYSLIRDEDRSETDDRAAGSDDESVERPIASDAREFDSGGVTIRGKVVDEHDQPVTNARVCASPAGVGRLSLSERRRRHCTNSDPAGRFALDDLAPLNHRISALARAHIPAHLDVWARDRGQEVTLRLRTGGVPVRGHVFDLTGGVIAGAWVSVDNQPAGVTTDDDGAFEIWTAPGRRHVFASSAGYVPGVAEIAAPTDEAEVTLAPGSSVHGKVIDADSGAPLAGVSIRATRETRVWSSVLADAYVGATITDDEGNFEIDRLTAGRFSLVVDDREAHGRYPGTVGLRLGRATGPVEVKATLRSGTAFAGRLVDADSGEPVHDCELQLSPAIPGEDPHGWVETDPDGKFEGRFLPGDYHPRVNSFCPTHVMPDGEPLLMLGTQPRTDLVFELQPAAVIAGTLLDDQDRPFHDAHVMVKSDKRTSFSPTQPDGTFRFTGLPPGTYEIEAGSDESPAAAEPARYELRPGESLTDIALVLPRGATVTGTLSDQDGRGIEGASISAVGQKTWEAKTLASGAFSIDGLADGSYVFKAMLDDGGVLRTPDGSDDVLASREITGADSPVEIELKAERATATITGEVLDDDGPVGDAFVSADRESAGGKIAAVSELWNRRPALTEPDGSFTLSGLPEGKYTIRAFRKDGTEGYAEHVDTGTSTKITFEPSASLSGTAKSGDGEPLGEFTIRMYDGPGGGYRNETFMATEGRYRIEGLRPGTWSLVLRAGGREVFDELTLEPGEDQTGHELALVPGVTVTGTVVDAVTGAGVPDIVVRTGGVGRSTTTETDGRFRIIDVAPGKATISARSGSFMNDGDYMTGAITVTVPEQGGDVGELPIVPRTLADGQNPGDFGITLEHGMQPSATIAAVRPNSPAAEAGVTTGCTISQMNGRMIEGNAMLVLAFLHVPEGTTVALSCAGDPEVYNITAGPPR